MKNKYDILILGGGMAGISMALSLALIKSNKPLKIAVLEKTAFNSAQPSSFDDRCIALSTGSKNIYQKMNVWDNLINLKHYAAEDVAGDMIGDAVEPIKNIHIGEQGKLGVARLKNSDEKVAALGYVVESHALGKILLQQLKQYKNITLLCPVDVYTISFLNNEVTIQYNDQSLSASLLIAADGNQSYAHQFLKSQPINKSYQQNAIICNIETQYPHQGQAFERFTESGPLAILPLTKNRCSVVWTVKEKNADKIMALADEEFIQQLQQQFGYRLGNILHTGKRFTYPLILKKLNVDEASQLQRLVFVGNAAHSIHPVTGQGFNLGLRDIDVLSQLITENIKNNQGKFVYQDSLIKDYWLKRKTDIKNVSRFTDTLIQIFSNKIFPLTPIRNFSLILFELNQPLKSFLARFAMGISP